MGEEDSTPALQVIVLGSGGGPQESNITAFLVRSVAQGWDKNSIVAVDAGVHLSVITRLIEEACGSADVTPPHKLTTGPFAGLTLPHASPVANAAYVTRSLVDTYLITHPHLDHISGFVVNTAGLPGTRPKKLAGLPHTIEAFKNHIFNNIIWPNLSDENNGAGLITYLRLVEGGSPALGDGEGRGYVEVCDGLLAKTYGVSHGHCIEKHSHRGSASGASTRFGSYDGSPNTPRRDNHGQPSTYPSIGRTQSLLSHTTLGGNSSSQGSGGTAGGLGGGGHGLSGGTGEQDKYCVYDSSAYFIQDHAHRREVLIFGDVEPDSISLSPRNMMIWQEAAPKIAAGTLTAIFIECSYDDSQSNDRLYGHLKPCFVIEEMRALAAEVEMARKVRSFDSNKKRKRSGGGAYEAPRRSSSSLKQVNNINTSGKSNNININNNSYHDGLAGVAAELDDPVSPKTVIKPPLSQANTPHLATPTSELSLRELDNLSPLRSGRGPLEGLKVVIIHVKERLTDGQETGETILEQLQEYEAEAQLGCEFIIARSGQSFYL